MANGCGDTLSLEDLQTAKKHQLFEAEVITGKQGGTAAGANIDYATNQVTGQTQKTMPAILRDAGFRPASFNFTTGGTLATTDADKVVYDPVSKAWYAWGGALPKVVPAATNPLLDANWKPQTDPDIRSDLASTSNVSLGDGMIGVKSDLAGAVARSQHAKNSDTISVMDFGAIGDGTTHPLSEVFSTLALAQVVYPFVTALTQSQDYAAWQSAFNTKKTVLIPIGNYVVNATVVLRNSVRIIGEGNPSSINRAQSFIQMIGNIALFTNDPTTSPVPDPIQVHIDGLYVYYGSTVPPKNAANWEKIAFNFKPYVAGTTALEMASISNCTVHGGWAAISDTSGTYLTRWQNVWARDCFRGFVKGLGTTMILDHCYTLGCTNPFEFGAVFGVTMNQCAMDGSNIANGGDGTGYAGIFADNCRAFSIIGFDAEGNNVTTDGGSTTALFHFKNTKANITGLTGVNTKLSTVAPAAAGNVAYFRATGDSQIILESSEDGINAGSDITYAGTGGFALTFLVEDTAKIEVRQSNYHAPTGGAPALAGLSQGAVSWFNTTMTGQVLTGAYIQTTGANGLQAPAFYTLKGQTVVSSSGVSTAMFDLPNSQGAYLISVWGSASGNNFFTTYLATYDGAGTAGLTAVKTAAFVTLQSSGRTIGCTVTGTGTFNWTYTKIG